MITVIVAFKNEKAELRRTLLSIREYSDAQIIAINDCSDDGINYKSAVSGIDNLLYVENRYNIGIANSRELGISLAKTDNILLLDGHMRLFESLDILDAIIEDKTIYCLNTKNIGRPIDPRFGAFIKWDTLQTIFIKKDYFPGQNIIDIPCILGAGYAFKKSYWYEFGGIKELTGYGLDEVVISTKVFLSGGSCKLIKDMYASHFYRRRFPYRLPDNCINENRSVVATLFFTGEELQRRLTELKCEPTTKVITYRNIEKMDEFITLNKYYEDGYNIE